MIDYQPYINLRDPDPQKSEGSGTTFFQLIYCQAVSVEMVPDCGFLMSFRLKVGKNLDYKHQTLPSFGKVFGIFKSRTPMANRTPIVGTGILNSIH